MKNYRLNYTPQQLPAKPGWFDRELEAIAAYHGKPMFRCVDGQRETVFRNGKTGALKYFPNRQNCWVIETYQPPSEIPEMSWEMFRFKTLKVKGVPRMVDVLGAFPRQGRYIFCLALVDAEGNPEAPDRRVITELRRRLWLLSQESKVKFEKTPEQLAGEEAEQQQLDVERHNDQFFQHAGITANRLNAGVIGKPMK